MIFFKLKTIKLSIIYKITPLTTQRKDSSTYYKRECFVGDSILLVYMSASATSSSQKHKLQFSLFSVHILISGVLFSDHTITKRSLIVNTTGRVAGSIDQSLLEEIVQAK